MPSRLRCQGFTLLELLVVLAIVIIGFAAIGISFSSGQDTTEIKGAARDLASALRHVRGEALLDHEEATLDFDLDANTYKVSTRSKVYRIPKTISLTIVTAESEMTGQSQGSIRFFPDGSSTGGRITLAREKSKWQIDINWLTGAIELQDAFDEP